MDTNTENEVLKFRFMVGESAQIRLQDRSVPYLNPIWTLPLDYSKLLDKANDMTADEVEDSIDDLMGEVEDIELKLKKAQTAFEVRE